MSTNRTIICSDKGGEVLLDYKTITWAEKKIRKENNKKNIENNS